MTDFIKDYEMTQIDRAKKDLKFKGGVGITFDFIRGDDNMTIDGKNYFKNIIGVIIKCYDHEIGRYMFGKTLSIPSSPPTNIAVLQEMVNLVNNYVGFEHFKIKDNIILGFDNYKDMVDSDCNMSDYEIGEMYMPKLIDYLTGGER